MKQLEFNLKILKKNLQHSFSIDTAFSSSTWASIFVSFIFGVFTVMFAELTFSNISSIGGYSKNDMHLFLMIGAINFFVVTNNIGQNMDKLSDAVHTGSLDLILTKPVNSLLFVSTSYLSIFNVIINIIPGIFPYFFLIDFSIVNPSPEAMIAFLILVLVGWVAMHFMAFILTVTVFWIGKNKNIAGLYGTFDYRLGRFIPFDIAPDSLKILFGIFIPVMIGTGVSVSVLLGNSDPLTTTIFYLFLAFILLYLEKIIWNFALKAYTSASS